MAIARSRFSELLRFEEPSIALLSRESTEHDGYLVEELRFRIGEDEVRGLLTRPLGVERRLPAILYGHSHGGGYAIGARELLDGREYLVGPLGPIFARAGYVTLCIDMPIFGERATTSESFAAKARLWYGDSLFGKMLCDHAAALTYLAGRDDVDASRIGAFGISMGCVLSYWLAALDDRIAAVAHLSCLADFRTMIELGAHDGHGIYLTVPGLLSEADGGTIAALVAPRPQLVCIGEADALTPPLSVERAWGELAPAYAATPDRLELVSEPGVEHRETERMRTAVLAFFGRWLKG
jgi:hypothetical protein